IEYKPLVDAAMDQAEHKPERVVVLQRPQAKAQMQSGRDLDWYELFDQSSPVGCTPMKSTDPLYIMYTSGTTGKPKGIVR
ncbi:AMP-binding protein, partial [Oceanospirillum sp. HFRX-1_2]